MSYKDWREAHPERVRELSPENAKRYREKMISLLGGKCCICGENTNLKAHHLRSREGPVNHREPTYEVINNPKGVVLLCDKHHRTIHKGNEQAFRLLKKLLHSKD